MGTCTNNPWIHMSTNVEKVQLDDICGTLYPQIHVPRKWYIFGKPGNLSTTKIIIFYSMPEKQNLFS